MTLYFKQGSSDKEYHVTIDPKDDHYVVNFAYGRRGATLQTGTKTNTPVDLQSATNIFGKLVTEKKSKGYTEGATGTPYQHTEKEDRVTNILPQLLNPIDDLEAQALLLDDNWCAQEKFDGRRIFISKEGASINGINRKGLRVGLPSPIVVAAQALKADFVLDGECVGDTLLAFDLLRLNGEDLSAQSYRVRNAALVNLIASGQQPNLQYAHAAWKLQEKRELLTTLRKHNKEGIVFKNVDAPYVAGRPNSGGTQLKHKFYATLSALVSTINAKRSIEIQLYNERGPVTAGNVTIPPNHEIPAVGQVVEIRYLYAFRESGCLYQPVYLGARSDVLRTECVTRQLKFKNGEDES
jgi:bifunctional non-homologous end joining protein LigD